MKGSIINNNHVNENNVRNGETAADGTRSAVVSLQFQAAQASDD